MIFNIDCLEGMKSLSASSVDVCITSPPYNLNIKYGEYKDDKPYDSYLEWMNQVFGEIKRILKPDGHFFLNVGYSNVQPWIAMDVANQAREYFILQNNIAWIKSIHIKTEVGQFDNTANNGKGKPTDEKLKLDDTFGFFKPIPGDKYISPTWENLFHFTTDANTTICKKCIGVSNKYGSQKDGPNCPIKRGHARVYKKFGRNRKSYEKFKQQGSNIFGYRNKIISEVEERLNKVTDKVNNKKAEDPYSNLRDAGNSWYVPYEHITSKSKKGHHPAIFPEQLVDKCIKLANINSGVVLDPFLGTGTTALVAKRCGLDFVGYEIDEQYFNYAKERLENDSK